MLDRTVIQANGAVNNDVGRACVPAFNAQIKLPRIELPRFSGAYEEWHSFYDMFGSLIHSNRDLNDTQKLHYLKSPLKGEAAEVVSSLEMTGDNYKDAWDRLSERYENKRLTVQNHIRAIFDLPVVKREDSVVIRQILDGVLKHTRALRSLDRPIDHWGDLLVHIVTSKLDMKSIKEWENSIESTRVPTFEELIEFLKKRCQTLEAVSKVGRSNRANANSLQDNVQRSKGCNVAATKFKCSYCQGDHSVYSCTDFKSLSVDERVKYIKSKGWCLNCLKGKHMARDCSLDGCKTCSKRHNSLLHPESPKGESSSESSLGKAKVVADKEQGNSAACGHACSTESYRSSQILLSTVLIKVKHSDGHFIQIKALLDSGAESSFITESLAQRLKLRRKAAHIEITGINQQVSRALEKTEVDVKSRFGSHEFKVQCIILSNLTRRVPHVKSDKRQFNIPGNIRLADPRFNVPSEIDLVIGTEWFWELMCVGQINLGPGRPILQKTVLGWLIVGTVTTGNLGRKRYASCNLSSVRELDEALRQFWKIDDIPVRGESTIDELACEEFFENTYERNAKGRFVVKLPVKEDVMKQMGESKDIARRRFLSLERRLDKDHDLKKEYVQFMQDCERLGHMKQIDEPRNVKFRIFLPHQAVVRKDRTSTKTRVVFDASSKDSKGVSLNDALRKGPTLQSDLFTIILRFRCHRYILTADVVKMYRQILVHEEHTPLQTIYWRENSTETMRLYELVTLTYGTKPASYIAVKCLQ
ncbi:PREDICTED: uncharacterized protein LOC105567357, partial [Vollenhovia emeryi]|uniref:uncharacterized protein LOC105567357 n=1 Tax=Vollenhovia emeryi TaxID=411798 RepID=UPI0005F57C23